MKNLSVLIAVLLMIAGLSGCGPSAKKVTDAEVHYTLGVSYLREPNPTMALREFMMAEALTPKDPRIQDALGQAYLLKKAYTKSEKHFLAALKLEPENPQYHNDLAALYLDMNRFDDAIHHFSRAAENLIFRSPEVSFTGMGLAQFKKGNFLEAVASYKKALAENPRYFRAHFRLGETYYALDNAAMAIAEYRETLRLVPGYPRAQYKLALALIREQQKAEAKEIFLQVVKAFPNTELGRLSADYLKILQ